MSRQGKMHSCPFHIESSKYKYAIEHEVPVDTKEYIDCPYISKGQNVCTKWNSGYNACMSHKCKEFKLKKQVSCSLCAYIFQKRCLHPRNPNKNTNNPKEGQFCCYCITEADNPLVYQKIHQQIILNDINRRIKKLERAIRKKQQYLRSEYHKLSSGALQTSKCVFYIEKISPTKATIFKQKESLGKLYQQRKKILKD